MDNVETTDMLLAVRDDTSTTHVTSASDHDDVSGVEVNKVNDLALLEVELDGIVGFDGWVRITDGAAVVSDNMRDTLGTESDLADLEKLERGFLRSDAVDGETTLDIVKETEVLAGLLNGDGV